MTQTLAGPPPPPEAAVRAVLPVVRHDRRWWALVVLGIAQLMVVLDATVVTIALPAAQADLGFLDADRQWVVTAYALAFGSLLLIGGRVADLFGRKRVFLVGLAGFAVASAAGGAAVSFEMLVAARAGQGVFGALLAPAALSLLTTTFTEPRERARAFGIFGGIAGAGASIGLLLGGVLTEYASWRWTMYVNLFFAAAAIAGAAVLMAHRPSEHRPRLDLPGTVLVPAGLFALVFGFSRAESDGWSDGGTVALLVTAAVLLVSFVVLESRVAAPLLPLRVVLDGNRGGSYLAMLTASAGMFAVFLFLTYYLVTVLGYTAVGAGVAFLPVTGALVLTAGASSVLLVPRVSPRLLVPGGMLVSALGMVVLTRIGIESAYTSTILPGILLIGVGLGLVFASALNLGTAGVDERDAGVASAMINTTQQVGGAIGAALLNTIAATAAADWVAGHAAGPTLVAEAAVHSYATAFWWAAAIFATGAALSGLLIRPGVPQVEEGAPVVAL
ncbi:MFS transporter [Blastococcus tunisiensis]|uniref:Drug resistance transporter, EmrB/QacA subfamily n=1 Tax=Blastococcus tunisiensis TaxID=1798228 RepID=A0A1I2KZS9_9ACTN|nr:MFS transporter [Blastococcus sp. DSM 46838]SFF71829.1 drug resistance transporter, EmrB/QacA subfamily [Blastococcus sp. DSM 46838]